MNRMYSLNYCIAGLTLLAFPVSGLAFEKPSNTNEKSLDTIVQKAMKDFEVPGVAVAIVRDNEVVYLKGHGVRELNTQSQVTADSLFAIASCTKAFTATAIGFLIQDGRMSWDDPVRKHLPFFRLVDPLADRDVTIRDLLCHRTGVVRHDILWVVHPWDRLELIRRSGFLKPDRAFRTEWGYNNLQYTAAGAASARAAGMPWEQLVQSRILDPLGMKATNFSIRELERSADYARPHARTTRTSGPIRVISPIMIDPMAPAGAINSCVRDLSAWIRFQLAHGEWHGKSLLKEEILHQTHVPVAVVPVPREMEKVMKGITVQRSYGLGWDISDYRGRRLISHGGSLDGYRSRVALLPEEQIGIAILSNLDATYLPEALLNGLLDQLLQAPHRDWNVSYLELKADQEAERKKREDRLIQERKSNTRPSLPLASYAGTYTESAHGDIQITQDETGLSFRWGKFTLPAEHWHFDTFRLKEPPVLYTEAFGDRLLLFRLDRLGEVEGFGYLGHDFKKVKSMKK